MKPPYPMNNLNYTTSRPTDLAGLEGRGTLVQDQTDEIMFSMSPTKMPSKILTGFRDNFNTNNRLTLDSGGFDLLLEPERADEFDVDSLINKVKTVGLHEQDSIMTLDFPVPTGNAITTEEVIRRQQLTTGYYEKMKNGLDSQVHPIIHGRDHEELKHHLQGYDLESGQTVAIGSNLALLKPRIYKCIGKGKGQEKPTDLPTMHDTWQRIMEGISLLKKEDQQVFALGMGGQRASQVAYLLGANEVDATSWWNFAMTRKMMLHEIGKDIHVGTDSANYTSEDVAYIKSLWNNDDYPLSQALTGLTWDQLWTGLRGPNLAKKGGLDGTALRAIHNIWSSDEDAKTCSEFADDPDGLAAFLVNRDQSKNNQFRKRIHTAMHYIGGNATVQAKLHNFSRF